MNCSHHLWEDPTGSCCTRTDPHDQASQGGHVYESRDGSCTNADETPRVNPAPASR